MAELQARHEATLSALSSQQAADSEAATWRLAAAEASAATARQQVEDMAAMYAEGNSMRGEDQARLRAQLRDLEVGGRSQLRPWILFKLCLCRVPLKPVPVPGGTGAVQECGSW